MRKTKQELYNMAVSELWLMAQIYSRSSILECSKNILLRYLPNASEVFQNEFQMLAGDVANVVSAQFVLAMQLKRYKGVKNEKNKKG